MGCCESTSKKYQDIYEDNAKITNEDNAIADAYKIKGIMLSNIEKCVCKIIRKTKTGSGFFCEVPEKNIKLLITNNHVIDEIYLEQGNKIAFTISENEKEIYGEIDLEKERFKLTNKELDFTIIEILNEDNIKKFLQINNEQYKPDDELFSYQYAGGVKLGFSFGKLLKKKAYALIYDVGTKGGSSGSPILLIRNKKVIGLHKGAIISENINEKINKGTPIDVIINQISYIKCIYEINDYNENQIINNTDGIELNKEVESKIKILNNGKKENIIFKKKFDKIGMNTIYFIIEEKLNDMSFLFNNCSSLKEINFISFETDNANSMKAMFQSCNKLENLDLSNFNTSKVTNMSRMFCNCNKLKKIKGIENFNTSQVINMKEMFQSCNELEYLDLSNFNVLNVTDKESIFNECNKLKEVKGREKFSLIQNNTKQETKSSFTYDRYSNYSDYSYQSRGYNEEKSERHHCKNTYCNRSIDSYEYKNYDGECEPCYCIPDD